MSFTSSTDKWMPLQLVPALTIGWSGAISAPRSRPFRIGPAAAEILVNASLDSAIEIAPGRFVPTGRSWPAWTARVSVIDVPAESLATVWISVAPSGTVIIAANVPSAPTVAWTPFTSTWATESPLAFAVTVPLTITGPAWSWSKLRAGEVTFRTGGSFTAPGPVSQAAVVTKRKSPVEIVRRFRIAVGQESKPRATARVAGEGDGRVKIESVSSRSVGDAPRRSPRNCN